MEGFFSLEVQTVGIECFRWVWLLPAKYLDVSSSMPVALGIIINFIHINSWLCLTSVAASPCFSILTGISNYEVYMKNLMYIGYD